MSGTSTADTIRTYSNAWRAGDIATIVALYDDSFVLHYPGANRLSGTHRGKAAALAAMRELSAVTKRKLVDLVDVMSGDGYASIIAREQFHVMGDDPPVIQRLAVYRIVDDRMQECWMYDGDQALIDRLIG